MRSITAQRLQSPLAGRWPPATLLVVVLAANATALAQTGERDRTEGQTRPLITEDVEIIRPGTVRVQAGIVFQQDQDFALSGLNGDITRVGEIGLHIGVSPNVEVQIDGTLQQFLSVNEQFRPSVVPLDLGTSLVDTQDVGDVTIATKIKFNEEQRLLPAFGVRFGFEMPNTNQSRGIGTNTTNVFAQVLAGKTLGRVRVLGNLGLAILQAPEAKYAQNDVVLYGLAFRVPVTDRVRVVGEVNGRVSTRTPPIGTENRSEARLGIQVDAAGLRWDAAGTFGLTRWSPNSGLVFGVTYDVKEAFEPTIK
jgi:hypothetical protein